MELKKLGKLVYLTLMFIYGFVVLALAISAYSKIKGIADNFTFLMDNWKSEFINSLTVSSSNSCPSGYVPLFPYNWPGTNTGCYCTSLASGACNSTQINQGCRTITAQAAQTWSEWQGGANICVKRISGYNFAEKALSYPLSCSSSEQACGMSSSIQVCVPKTQSCPITKMVIATSPPTDTSYQSIPYYGSYNVYYTTTANSFPVVESVVMEDKPCEDKTHQNISPLRTDYTLMKSKRTHCSDYDNRWSIVSTIAEPGFYSGNGQSGLTTTLPGFVISSSYSWSQSIRNNFQWSYSSTCREFGYKVYVYKDQYNLASNFQVVIMAINIVAAIFLSILFPFFEIQNLRGVDLPCFPGKGEEEEKKIEKTAKVLKYLFKFIQLPFFIAAVVISGAIRGVFVIVGNENCSDSLTNQQFKDVGDALNKQVYSGNITNLALLLAFLALDIVLQLKKRYCSKPPTKVQSESPNTGRDNAKAPDTVISPTIEMGPMGSNEQSNLINPMQPVYQQPPPQYQQPPPQYQQPPPQYQQPPPQYQQPPPQYQQPPPQYQQPAPMYQQPIPQYQQPMDQQNMGQNMMGQQPMMGQPQMQQGQIGGGGGMTDPNYRG